MASQYLVELEKWGVERVTRIGANVLIFGLWLWLYRPVFDYLGVIFSRNDFRTNQVMLVGVVGLILWQIHRHGVGLTLDAGPRLFVPGLALALGGSALYLVVERFLDVNTLSASLFGLASYGLLGLWMGPRRWQEGLPAALLLIGTLPFGEHMETFIGYPMRLLTARIVRDGLAAAGTSSVGVDTILVLENGVSDVDLPCSGVKSLWSGALFFVAATWVDRRRLNLRWLLMALILGVMLLAANLARVAILVVAGQVMGWELLAEMVHVPLGVIGFAAVCGMAAALLSLQPKMAKGSDGGEIRGGAHPVWLTPALAVVLLAMGLVYAPRPETGLAQGPRTWAFPGRLVMEPEPLRPDEVAWLTRDGAESAERFRFEWPASDGDGEISGSLMLITSRTWRAQHRPERCFEVYGLSLNGSRVHLVEPDFPVRFVSLGDEDSGNVASATYWFQSAERTTADYGTRMWADLAAERERWVLVTVVFDGVWDPCAADVEALYRALHDGVARSFE